jgi:hypothetical protein
MAIAVTWGRQNLASTLEIDHNLSTTNNGGAFVKKYALRPRLF